MHERKKMILQAIVQNFIQNAIPVGSRALREECDFPFSAATIRNEMGQLEEEGFLESPHTSSGRIPTQSGFRFFVANCTDNVAVMRPKVENEFSEALLEHLAEKRSDERVFDAVGALTKMTPNMAFASVPSASRMFFLGFSNVLRQPEFSLHPKMASGVFRILEENFETVLNTLDLSGEAQIFIGNENVIPEIQSCSLIVTDFQLPNKRGFLGVLGPMRMDYARNSIAVETAKAFLQI